MKDVFYYNELYDLYKNLLTDKQREYFEGCYFEDLSLKEMADDYNVSRNAVFRQVHIVTDKLDEYEDKLGLFKKKKILLEIVDNINDKELKDKLEQLL